MKQKNWNRSHCIGKKRNPKCTAPTPRARNIAIRKCVRKALAIASLRESILHLADRYDFGPSDLRSGFKPSEFEYLEKVRIDLVNHRLRGTI